MSAAELLEIPVRDDASEFMTFDRGSRTLDALREVGLDVRGQNVVDLGAGFGSLSIACARAGAASVTAVDIHPERLSAIADRARVAGTTVATYRADLLEPWSGPSGKADVGFLIGVVEYAGLWQTDEDVAVLQRKVFRAAFAALRPGGWLVFGSKNRWWPRFVYRDANTHQPFVNVLPRRAADKVSEALHGKPYRHHIHGPRGWSKLMTQVGFAPAETYLPYLSYQFPLKMVRSPTLSDVSDVKSRPGSPEERQVAWGRTGAAKALVMVGGSALRLPLAHSVVMLARRPGTR